MPATSLLTLRLPPATQKRLTKLAKACDRTKSKLAADAIEKYLDANEWQVEAIEEGIRAADAGELIPHEEVAAWAKSLGKRPVGKRSR